MEEIVSQNKGGRERPHSLVQGNLQPFFLSLDRNIFLSMFASKRFGSADCYTMYTIYIFSATQSADSNPFRGTHRTSWLNVRSEVRPLTASASNYRQYYAEYIQYIRQYLPFNINTNTHSQRGLRQNADIFSNIEDKEVQPVSRKVFVVTLYTLSIYPSLHTSWANAFQGIFFIF